MANWFPLLLFLAVCVALMAGFPVAFTLSGVALLFALIGYLTGYFDAVFLEALTNRMYEKVMTEPTLMAVPLFIFMGVMLERSKIAEELLESMGLLLGKLKGGLGVAVLFVGMLMAASTGIVGATVVTMGLLSLPTMMKQGYDPKLATGSICAAGTLGQIIPPSIVLVLLGSVLSNAYQQAQLDMGIYSPKAISVGDLFMGALIPGLLLVLLYLIYIIAIAILKPEKAPAINITKNEHTKLYLLVLKNLIPPFLLIIAVLGSIMTGVATPTEAASVGAVGAMLLALIKKQFNLKNLTEVMQSTVQITSMVFLILIGASLFSLVFKGFGGDEIVQEFLSSIPGGVFGAMLTVMVIMFILGFVLDFIEITFMVVPIVGPILLAMGLDPIWLGIMIAINLQTSFLTPPFGFALFYLRGVADSSITTSAIYKGVFPFIIIQLIMLILLAFIPELATWLPNKVYG